VSTTWVMQHCKRATCAQHGCGSHGASAVVGSSSGSSKSNRNDTAPCTSKHAPRSHQLNPQTSVQQSPRR
jgi:hypothetical protein